VRKKVYKKTKGVIFDASKLKNNRSDQIRFITISLAVITFLVSSLFYYVNAWYIVSNATPVIGTRDVTDIKSLDTAAEMPVTTPIAQKLLEKHTAVVSKPKKSITSDQIVWHGPRNKKEVALTFDADMTPVMVDWLHDGQVATYNDPRITDYLMQNRIKATFFLTGLWIESYPDVTKELAENPLFELENHSYSHPSMAGYCFDQPQIPQSQYPSEIEKVQQLLQQIAHVTPKYFRFPGGCYDQSDLALVKKEGLVTVHWDDVANDGFNNNEDEIIHNVLSEAHNGSIIVMHIGGAPNVPQTANALPDIISSLRKQGYTFVTVSELLNPIETAQKINPKKYLSSLENFKNVYPDTL